MVATSSPGTVSSQLRRAHVALGCFLAWTAFVWVGRIRNAASDVELVGTEKVGPLLLAASFLVPAMVLAVAWVRSLRARRRLDRRAGVLLVVLAAWTTGLWVVRAVDIAAFGDWSVGFIVVHTILAVVSIGLASWAVVADRASAPLRTQVD
jgi:hypothetical protein